MRNNGDRSDTLVIGGKTFISRLMVGTGKYESPEDCVAALDASGAEIVTVAIRRLDLNNPNARTELDYIDWQRYTILPNTAGCKTAEEAVFTARLARELTGSSWVKLEVIPDPRYLLPDPIGTLEAAQTLVKDGFTVLPYIHADPVLAKRLEETGCATVMPLGSPIGSGRGILTLE
jgi:thiazole synthase